MKKTVRIIGILMLLFLTMSLVTVKEGQAYTVYRVYRTTYTYRYTITYPYNYIFRIIKETPYRFEVKPPVSQTPVAKEPLPPSPGESQVPSSGYMTVDEQKMLELVNSEREKAGLAPLIPDKELIKLARMKSRDMIENNYFGHNSPVYGSPFEMMKSYGISYKYAGENIAGAPTVEKAHSSLMNSPGHRRNILNPNYTHVGIGIIDGGPYGKMFTQLFISK